MNKLYKILVCIPLCLMLFITSCNDTLDIAPTSTISTANFFKTEDDVKGALYGMYIRLRTESAFTIYALGELRGETTTSSVAGTGFYDYFYNNTLSPDNPGAGAASQPISWQGLYSIVNAANLIIKYTPGITFISEATKNSYLAQAYTTRAFVYYVMTRTWGDLPLRIEPVENYDPATVQLARSPQAEVFALIKSDLDKAISLFPNNNFPNATATGRSMWTKPAANALKGDVYLWTGKRMNGGATDFNTALTALTAVKTGDIDLLPNYASVFEFANKGNREIIMAVAFAPVEAVDNYGFNGYVPSVQYTALNAAGKTAAGTPGGNMIWAPSATLRNQFTADDTRKNATYLELTNANGNAAGSIITKMKGTVVNGVRFFADDVILYRYADVLLMIAEAKSALGQSPATEINLVRGRAYNSNITGNVPATHLFVSGSQAANDEAILQERLLELAFEGKRWWDLVRFGKAFEKVPSLQNRAGQTHLLLHPIPTTVRSLEPLVSQNPGYTP